MSKKIKIYKITDTEEFATKKEKAAWYKKSSKERKDISLLEKRLLTGFTPTNQIAVGKKRKKAVLRHQKFCNLTTLESKNILNLICII